MKKWWVGERKAKVRKAPGGKTRACEEKLKKMFYEKNAHTFQVYGRIRIKLWGKGEFP